VYMYDFNLKDIRKKKGVSQKDLAKSLKTTQQQISKYEKMIDIPSLQRLIEIAHVFNVSLDELVQIKNIHKDYSKSLRNNSEGEKK